MSGDHTPDKRVARREAGRKGSSDTRQISAELRAELDALRKQYGQFSDSAELIRKDRDGRG
jgi:hypothetical protein